LDSTHVAATATATPTMPPTSICWRKPRAALTGSKSSQAGEVTSITRMITGGSLNPDSASTTALVRGRSGS
jgi:hypothetical protein